MDPKQRTLLKVVIDSEEREETADCVERLMGNKPEARFAFIQENAAFRDGVAGCVRRASLTRRESASRLGDLRPLIRPCSPPYRPRPPACRSARS